MTIVGLRPWLKSQLGLATTNLLVKVTSLPFLELDISLRDHFIDRRDAKSDVACQTQISNSHKKREKSGIACLRTIISMEGSKKVANE